MGETLETQHEDNEKFLEELALHLCKWKYPQFDEMMTALSDQILSNRLSSDKKTIKIFQIVVEFVKKLVSMGSVEDIRTYCKNMDIPFPDETTLSEIRKKSQKRIGLKDLGLWD